MKLCLPDDVLGNLLLELPSVQAWRFLDRGVERQQADPIPERPPERPLRS
jgi:hypothetical protein